MPRLGQSARRLARTPLAKTLLCLLLLLLGTAAVFWKIVFTEQYTFFGQHDNAELFYPWHQYSYYAIRHHFLPLWDPYAYGGHIYIGDTQPGIFYPLNLLMFQFQAGPDGLLPLRVMDGFLVLGHFLAGCFMFLLARRLGISRWGSVIAGLCFALSGFLGRLSVGYVNVFQGAIWLPLVFHMFLNATSAPATAGRIFYAMAAGLFLAISMLAGHHNPAVYIILSLAVFALYRIFSRAPEAGGRAWSRRAASTAALFGVFLVTALGVAALQLLPTLQFAPHAMRWAGVEVRPGETIPYGTLADTVLQPRDVVSFVFPTISFSAEAGPYLGVLPLLLALLAVVHLRRSRPIRFFALLMAISLLYAWGNFSLLHGLAYALLPYLDKARQAVRALYVTHFSMAVLAGFGADLLLRSMDRKRARDYHRLLRAVNLFTVFVAALVFSAYVLRSWVMAEQSYADNYIVLPVVLLVVSAFVFNARRYHLVSRQWLKVLIVLVLLFDFSAFSTWGILEKSKFDGKSNSEPEQYFKPNEIIRFLSSQPGHYRVDIRDGAIPLGMAHIYGVAGVLGIGATVYLDYWDFVWSNYDPDGRPLALLNTRYIVSKKALNNLKLLRDGEVKIYENPNAFPRAWLVHSAETVPDRKTQLQRINDPSFDPRTKALTTSPLGLPLTGDGRDDRVEIKSYRPNSLALHAATGGNALLVLSEVDYPGWEADVDGKRTRIYRTDGILRGVVLPPGNHEVRLRFRPATFRIGAWISAIAVLAIGVAGILYWRRPREGREGGWITAL